MIRDYFSLNAWHNYGDHEFWVVRLRFDWWTGDKYEVKSQGVTVAEWAVVCPPWVAIDVGLLGLCASLMFWPKGKAK